MDDDKITRQPFDAENAVYPLPFEVGALLDAAGTDREGFQDVIRGAQPFCPALQRTECLVLAMSYIEAAADTLAAIKVARGRRPQ